MLTNIKNRILNHVAVTAAHIVALEAFIVLQVLIGLVALVVNVL